MNIFSLACLTKYKFDHHVSDTDKEMNKQKYQLFSHRNASEERLQGMVGIKLGEMTSGQRGMDRAGLCGDSK